MQLKETMPKSKEEGWEYSLMVEYFPSLSKTLGSSPTPATPNGLELLVVDTGYYVTSFVRNISFNPYT